MSTPHLTKRELRDQRRSERQAAEQADAARATRRRRFQLLGGAVGLAVVVVAVLIAVSSSGAPKKPVVASASAAAQAAALVKGIPEHDGVLGNPSAKVTVTEFIDLQCPICKAASTETLPTLIQKYVRTGKVKLQARTLQFIGADSVTAARYAAGAEQQGKLWPFIEAFYASQGEENSGYVTDSFLRSVAVAAGVNPTAASDYAATDASNTPLNLANNEASALGVNATPTFAAAKGGGADKILAGGSHDAGQLSSALDALLT